MIKKFELLIALSYLKITKPSGIVALFSIIGIFLGVATLIVTISILSGFEKEMRKYFIDLNGHIKIINYPYIQNLDSILDILKQSEHIDTYTLILEEQALITNEKNHFGVLVRGIEKQYIKTDPILKNILNINIENFQDNSLILGDKLFNKLFTIDNTMKLLSFKGVNTIFGTIPNIKTFKIFHSFNTGIPEYDENLVYIPLDMAKKLFKTPYINTINIFIKNDKNIPFILKEIRKINTNNLVYPWNEYQYSFFQALKIQKKIAFIILTLIIIVAAFNIISSLTMLVNEKKKDIAILKSLGMYPLHLTRIFIITGLLIGIIGTILGGIFGITITIYINEIHDIFNNIFDTNLFDKEFYNLNEIPQDIRMYDLVIILLSSIFLAFLATILPSLKAFKNYSSIALKNK